MLAWTANIARRQPGRVAGALLAVAVTWWVALAAFGSPVMAAAGCAALLGALAEGLFPIHYRITPAGVRARCAWQVRNMAWEAVRSVWAGPDGVYLCPFARPSRFLRTRGIVLRYNEGNNSAVLEAVRRYWKQEGAPSSGTEAAP